MNELVVRTTLNIDAATHRRLSDLARQNDRSTSAEARVALRRHLERAGIDTVTAAAAANKTRRLPAPASGGSTAVDSGSLEGRGRSSARSTGRALEQEPGHGKHAD